MRVYSHSLLKEVKAPSRVCSPRDVRADFSPSRCAPDSTPDILLPLGVAGRELLAVVSLVLFESARLLHPCLVRPEVLRRLSILIIVPPYQLPCNTHAYMSSQTAANTGDANTHWKEIPSSTVSSVLAI